MSINIQDIKKKHEAHVFTKFHYNDDYPTNKVGDYTEYIVRKLNENVDYLDLYNRLNDWKQDKSFEEFYANQNEIFNKETSYITSYYTCSYCEKDYDSFPLSCWDSNKCCTFIKVKRPINNSSIQSLLTELEVGRITQEEYKKEVESFIESQQAFDYVKDGSCFSCEMNEPMRNGRL